MRLVRAHPAALLAFVSALRVVTYSAWSPEHIYFVPGPPPQSEESILAELRAGEEPAAVADGVGQDLPLIVFDSASVSKMIEGVVQKEVEGILGEIGVTPTWVDGDSTDVMALMNDFHIKVLILDSRPIRWGLPWNTLGATPGGTLPPTIMIFMPVIDFVVGNRKIARKTGRAIACVIIHELVHVMDPGRPHQDEGLMAWSQSDHGLYSGCLELDETSAAAFLWGLQRVRAMATPDAAGSEGLRR